MRSPSTRTEKTWLSGRPLVVVKFSNLNFGICGAPDAEDEDAAGVFAASFAGDAAKSEKADRLVAIARMAARRRRFTSGAEAPVPFALRSARLKSRPFKTQASVDGTMTVPFIASSDI